MRFHRQGEQSVGLLFNSSRCGPWVVGGWQSVFKDTDALARLGRLLDGWSKVTNNQMLKLAAEAALKTPKGGR